MLNVVNELRLIQNTYSFLIEHQQIKSKNN